MRRSRRRLCRRSNRSCEALRAEAVERLAARGRRVFITDFAEPLPVAVFMIWPTCRSRRRRVFRATAKMPAIPTAVRPPFPSWSGSLPFCARTWQRGGQRPGSDLLSTIACGTVDGRLVIDRANARAHLAYGTRIHRCLGSHAANLQLRILWEEALARFPRIELAGEPRRAASNFSASYVGLPVRIPSV